LSPEGIFLHLIPWRRKSVGNSGKMSDISGQTRRFLQDSHILALLIGKHYKLCFVNPVFAFGRIENQGKNRRKFSKF